MFMQSISSQVDNDLGLYHSNTHFSRTRTLAPLDTICDAVVKPPIPLPMMIASYSTSMGASVVRCATSDSGG